MGTQTRRKIKSVPRCMSCVQGRGHVQVLQMRRQRDLDNRAREGTFLKQSIVKSVLTFLYIAFDTTNLT